MVLTALSVPYSLDGYSPGMRVAPAERELSGRCRAKRERLEIFEGVLPDALAERSSPRKMSRVGTSQSKCGNSVHFMYQWKIGLDCLICAIFARRMFAGDARRSCRMEAVRPLQSEERMTSKVVRTNWSQKTTNTRRENDLKVQDKLVSNVLYLPYSPDESSLELRVAPAGRKLSASAWLRFFVY